MDKRETGSAIEANSRRVPTWGFRPRISLLSTTSRTATARADPFGSYTKTERKLPKMNLGRFFIETEAEAPQYLEPMLYSEEWGLLNYRGQAE